MSLEVGDETRNTNLGVLLNQITTDQKSLVRKLEKLDQKIVNCSYAIKFNETCVKEDILPKYTDIYIYIYIYIYI